MEHPDVVPGPTSAGGDPASALADPETYRAGRQYALWARLRAAGAVAEGEAGDGSRFWSVLSYQAAGPVLADPAAFSSTGGMRLGAEPAATAAAAGRMLALSDPPRHGRIRRLVSDAFTPRMIRRLEHTIRTVAAEIVESAVTDGTCDLAEVAGRLPASVVCDLVGVPRADWDFMLGRTKTAYGAGAHDDTDATARAREAHTDILLYYDELMRRRRQDPRDDLVSALVHGSIDGAPVTEEEVILNCDGLITAGNETTRQATVAGLRALIHAPDQWRRLQRDPGLLATAVPELLRYTTPVMHVLRTARREVEVAGRVVPAGDRVVVWLGSANRDERQFPDPARLDLGRSPNRHLAFAHGPHYCLGGALATTELMALFEELARQVEDLEPAGPEVRMRSNLIDGYESFPVRLKRRG